MSDIRPDHTEIKKAESSRGQLQILGWHLWQTFVNEQYEGSLNFDLLFALVQFQGHFWLRWILDVRASLKYSNFPSAEKLWCGKLEMVVVNRVVIHSLMHCAHTSIETFWSGLHPSTWHLDITFEVADVKHTLGNPQGCPRGNGPDTPCKPQQVL